MKRKSRLFSSPPFGWVINPLPSVFHLFVVLFFGSVLASSWMFGVGLFKSLKRDGALLVNWFACVLSQLVAGLLLCGHFFWACTRFCIVTPVSILSDFRSS